MLPAYQWRLPRLRTHVFLSEDPSLNDAYQVKVFFPLPQHKQFSIHDVGSFNRGTDIADAFVVYVKAAFFNESPCRTFAAAQTR